MASALKRKRAPADVLEVPKRAKSTKGQSSKSVLQPTENPGWNLAFNPPTAEKIAPTNGLNGNGRKHDKSKSPEAVDFEDFLKDEAQVHVAEERQNSIETRVKKIVQLATEGEFGSSQTVARTPQNKNNPSRSLEKSASKVTKKKATELWKISEAIGGRLINVDPVFTPDEKFLIVANRTTIQVYSTSNSLLTRSIKVKLNVTPGSSPRIITFSLSPSESNIIWVACSDAQIFRIDWTTGVGAEQSWGVSSSGCVHMTVASMESAGRRRDVVFTTEIRKDGGFRITANELAVPESGIVNAARTIYTSNERIGFLKTGSEGSIIVGSSGKRILVGRLRSTEYETIDKIRYEFRVFESTDPIKSLDIQVSERSNMEAEGLKKAIRKTPVVDVVVGDINGVVFVHNDLVLKLFMQSQEGNLPSGLSLVPRKMHWHRQAVHTVKWSLDGNYVISGGTETVLVLWQLDTGKQQFLPHLSATIQNVVVSPTGASYAVQLDDNSAMILSTAELQPTANISGIQLPVVEVEEAIDSQVRKLEGSTWLKPLVQRTPAVVNPVQPSQLLLGVGQSQGIRPTKPKKMSNSFLETFDLGAGHNIYRQALARTNITNVDAAPGAQRLNEPRVTHIKISHDGQWLATIDEWIPPVGDIDFLKHGRKSLLEEQRHRREVFLKFWQWNKEGANWELASRVNAPHNSGQETGDAGRILDLAVDPNQPRFSTIGEDGIVRTWIPKTRKRDGIIVRGKDKRPLKIWFCQHAVFLGKTELADSSSSDRNAIPSTGLVAFSEDSSLLAAACSNDEGLIHLISPDSGTVRSLHTGLFDNEIFGLQILGQDLIILSSNLLVFDLVSQELRYGLKLKPNVSSLSIEQKQEMMHLAIDERSHTFALALPRFSDPEIKGTEQNLWQAVSELLVFAHDSTEPQLNEVFPSIISALIPSVGSEGFLVLDTNAEVRTVGKKGSQPITALAQSTSALQLDSVSEEPEEGVLLRLVEGPEDIEQDQLPIPNATQTEEQNEDAETPVVTQQQLAQVFDIGPAFALPPVEEMFYQVAGLFSSKPKPVS